MTVIIIILALILLTLLAGGDLVIGLLIWCVKIGVFGALVVGVIMLIYAAAHHS